MIGLFCHQRSGRQRREVVVDLSTFSFVVASVVGEGNLGGVLECLAKGNIRNPILYFIMFNFKDGMLSHY